MTSSERDDQPTGLVWIDSHCHVESAGGVDVVRRAAADAGVSRVVDVGTALGTSRVACENARSAPGLISATVGLHPHDASRIDDEWDALVELASAPEVVAIGETGFDFHYNHSPRDAQEDAFRRHIRLAGERDLALVIHTRNAWEDTLRVLRDEGVPRRTVFHCFSGGPAEAERVLELGAFCSFSGVVSFKNAADVRDAAALVPADRMLVETDAPYLAPVPMRGKPNEPAYLPHVGAALAQARGEAVAVVARATAATAAAVFGFLP